MKKKNKLKHLSQSVLLEEENLPKANKMISLVIFLIVVAFISWSFFMEIDQRIDVVGFVNPDQGDESKLEIVLKIPPREVENIIEGQMVTIQVTAEESTQFIGQIDKISPSLYLDQAGFTYHEAVVSLNLDPTVVEYYEKLHENLHISASLKTGKRTLFVYIMRPFYSALDNSLQEP